jgi:hypothetical protein
VVTGWRPATLAGALAVAISAHLVRPSLAWLMRGATGQGRADAQSGTVAGSRGVSRDYGRCAATPPTSRWQPGA